MRLRRMLLALFLVGLCCVSLAACIPETSPSEEPESSSSGDTLTTAQLPGGWDAADFTVLLFVYLQAPDGRTLGVGSLINSDQSMLALQDEETSLLYAGSPEAVEQAQALRETVTARRDSLLPSGEAEILYPDLLPEALTSTGAYRIAAADPTAVINYSGRIATGRTAVDTFCKALENGGTGELTLYTFAPNYADPEKIRCSYTRFWTDGGSTQCYLDFSEDSSFAFMEPSRYEVQALELSDYGYLAVTDESSSEPTGYPVISDRLLREDADLRIQLYERYLEPVLTSTALEAAEWDSLEEIPRPLWVVEDLYRYDHQNTDPFDVYGTDWPVDEMAAQLSRYFDGVTEKLLIDKYQDICDLASGTIHYEGGRGGGPYYLRVTGWEEDGDRLTLRYEKYSHITGEPYEGSACLLTVRLLEDDAFRYLGNHKACPPSRGNKKPADLMGLSVFCALPSLFRRRLRELAEITPFTAREQFQFLRSELDCAVGAAAGRIDNIEPPQRRVQIHLDPFFDTERTDAAHYMAHQLHGLLGGEHLGLGMELLLVLVVIHLGIAGCHHEHNPLRCLEGQGLGNAGALTPQGGSCQFHSGAGYGEFLGAVPITPLGEIIFYQFK